MSVTRNTRIICTMGPAIQSVDLARSLIRNGMNIARFNFSHGDHDYHGAGIQRVREAAALEKTAVGILLDTKGPEIRTGEIRDAELYHIEQDDLVTVLSGFDALAMYGDDGVFADKDYITISYKALADDIKAGARILIADGLAALEVLKVEDRLIRCKALNSASFGSRKNVNVIGVKTRLPALNDKDREDLRFGIQQDVDFIAVSFIRKASDVTSIQKFLANQGAAIPVIAKIEDEEGLLNINEIIRVSSGIMIARGDLGVQIPAEQVPLEQKRIISLCNAVGKPVITATQMLESMVKNPRPTRAEAGDVANAILDGTDCVMLSGETANGAFPEEAVAVMDRIARTVERSEEYSRRLDERRRQLDSDDDIALVIAEAASRTADRIHAAAMLVPTMSGNTARLISRYRPGRPVIAATPNEQVRRRLLLHWGLVPLAVQQEEDSESMIQGAIGAALREGYVVPSDKVVVTAGLPINTPLLTNSIRVHVIANVLGRGAKGFGGRCTGRIVKAENLEAAHKALRKSEREILLTHTLDDSFIPVLRLVDGVILEGVSEMPWDLLKATNPALVYVSMVPQAMRRFEDGITVTLDGAQKLVYEGSL